MRVRKQVYELVPADLAEHPIWEFALDEEDVEDQDEATVRPWEGGEPLDPAEGMFVVRASMTLADGTRLLGFLTPSVRADDSIATIQPSIVTDHGQVDFWFGAFAPPAARIDGAYAILGRDAAAVFPLHYESDVALEGGPVSGVLPGFLHFRSLDDLTVVEVR
jgi:hypothetical protein